MNHLANHTITETSLLVLPDAPEVVTIICCAGAAWITQEGDAEDRLLRQSERCQITRRGRIVAQGLSEAHLLVLTDKPRNEASLIAELRALLRLFFFKQWEARRLAP